MKNRAYKIGTSPITGNGKHRIPFQVFFSKNTGVTDLSPNKIAGSHFKYL